MKIKPEFTEQQFQALCGMLDVAVGVARLRCVKDAAEIMAVLDVALAEAKRLDSSVDPALVVLDEPPAQPPADFAYINGEASPSPIGLGTDMEKSYGTIRLSC